MLNESKIWDARWNNIKDLQKYVDVRNSNDPWTNMHFDLVDKYMKSLNKDAVFLEAGCGLGQWCFYASETYDIKSIGVDVAIQSIDRLNNYLKAKKIDKISFYYDDLNKTQMEQQSCDMLVCLGVIEHFKNSNTMLRNLNKILKKDGIGIITVPNIISFHTILRPFSKLFGSFKIGYEKSFSSAGLKSICKKNGFRIIEYGVLPSGYLFGLTLNRFFPSLEKISKFVEKRTKNIGFILFVVVSK